MTKITIELDDRLAERLAIVSRAHNLSVEQWLRTQARAQSLTDADGSVTQFLCNCGE
jgi:predicted transcriptional regulator